MSGLVGQPKIVADFEYEGQTWLVLDWPADEEEAAHFVVSRDDVPWHWKSQPYEDVRS